MVSETFELMNEKELHLSGIIESQHPRKKQPAVIFLNGFLDTLDAPVKKKLAEQLQKDGFVTARFDYTHGFGSGEGDISQFTLSNQVIDIDHVVDHVMRRGYVDPKKIVLMGHCFGGMAAILFAAFDDRVKALVSISTPYWFEDTNVTRMEDRELSRMRLKRYFHLHHEEVEKEIRIDYTFFEDGMKKDMARAVRNLQQPVLLIHGRQDESIPPENSEEIANRVPGKHELHILETMGHRVGMSDIKELYPLLKAFFKKQKI